MSAAVRLLIADDNPIVRMGLRSLLDAVDGIDVIGEAVNGQETVTMSRALDPDVVLCDVRMPGLDGVGAAQQIAGTTNVLMLTYSDEPDIIRTVMAAGAKGYLVHGTHEPDEIAAAVLSAARGSTVLGPAATRALLGTDARTPAPSTGWGLSAREVEVMELVAKGLSNRDIAKTCYLAEKTVKNHLNRIFPKLDVTTRSEAIALWLRTTASPEAR